MDTQAIKAIPTDYAGYSFRSRLEARVAAGLDRLGARWVYEPEAFELTTGDRYLPDFRVAGKYIEVKSDVIVDDGKIKQLALDLRQTTFLVVPNDWERTIPMGHYHGGVEDTSLYAIDDSRRSAVWSPCPGCGAMQPWAIGCEEQTYCCQESFATEEWWDAHYNKPSYKTKTPWGLVLPQYKDRQMIWRN